MKQLAILAMATAIILPIALSAKSGPVAPALGCKAVTGAKGNNPEMAAIFTADQDDRRTPDIDWTVVGSRDDARYARTAVLVDSSQLTTGRDFYLAAFIYQHGSKPDDYLKAHVLAMTAMACGNRDAAWIASATLDRYLQSTGKPQIFGTQYHGTPDGKMTQQPFEQGLVPDSVRTRLGVPPIAAQEELGRQLQSGKP